MRLLQGRLEAARLCHKTRGATFVTEGRTSCFQFRNKPWHPLGIRELANAINCDLRYELRGRSSISYTEESTVGYSRRNPIAVGVATTRGGGHLAGPITALVMRTVP